MTPGLRSVLRDGFHLLLAVLVTPLLLAMAMPGGFGWWPLLFIALAPLLAFSASKGPRLSFTAGLLTGFFYHISLLYWIVIVLGRYGGLPPALSFPAMLVLSLYMGVYMALFAWGLSRITGPRHTGVIPVRILLAAPALWAGLDWLRSILFSGFPWMDLGYGLAAQPILIQAADLGGHHLVTFTLVLANSLLVVGLDRLRHGNVPQTCQKERPALILAATFLICIAGYSFIRYQQVAGSVAEARTIPVAVVQGNIPQDEKWTPARKRSTLETYQTLSQKASARNHSILVVWPETALPFFPSNDPLFDAVTGWADSNNTWLLTGTPYFTLDPNLEKTFNRAVSYYNSALLINDNGDVTGRYDKRHLVPYGEYVPMRRLLPFLAPLVEIVGDFSLGKSSEPLSMNGVQLGVLICYESIFPGLAREEVAAGADILVNITNDAWYGRSSAPYQSFAMTILRAVETRRALVRAANTGISGFVDPAGRVIEKSPIFEELALNAEVPILQTSTVFTRFGYLFGPACLVLAGLMVAGWRRRE